jgi:hypothetical protein
MDFLVLEQLPRSGKQQAERIRDDGGDDDDDDDDDDEAEDSIEI